MTDYAYIMGRRHSFFRGRYYNTFEWQGKAHWPVLISYSVFDPADLSQLPWPLRKVEDCPPLDAAIYVRTDVAGGWWARLVVARKLLGQRWMWFYVRLIMTAMVWECAYVPTGTAPSWRDLKWPWSKRL